MKRLLVVVAMVAMLLPMASLSQGPPAAPPVGPGPGPALIPPPGAMSGTFRIGPADTTAALMPPPAAVFRVARIADDLKLTDDQKSRLNALMDQFQKDQQKLMDGARDANRVLRQSLTDPAADVKKIQTLTAESQRAGAAMAAAEIDVWMQIRTILTTDQLKQLTMYVSGPNPGTMPPPGGPPRAPGAPPPGGPPPG